MDARTTFVQDPETLPEFSDVVEAVVRDAQDMAPVAPIAQELVPLSMLDDEDEMVKVVHAIITIAPSTEEEFIGQAERVRRCAGFLITQKRRIDMLLAELAHHVRVYHLWRFLGDHCQSEAQFWQIVTNGATQMNKINQLVDLRTHVVPMLHAAEMDDKVLEEVDGDKARELIRLARSVNSEERDPEVVREQVHSIVEASPSVLNELRQMARSEEPKQAIIITMKPQITSTGERLYACSFTMTEEQAHAYAARNSYFIHSVGGESVHISRLADTLREWEPVEEPHDVRFNPLADDIDLTDIAALMDLDIAV